MLAALISISLFAVCAVIGFGLQAWLLRDSAKVQVLLAPTIGAGVLVLAAISINRLGVPLERFALPLVAIVTLLALFGSRFAPGALSWKRYWPFIAILAAAFLLNARPIFQYDLNFLSYGNDDMANYALGAQRIVAHGYFDIPNTQSLLFNRDSPLIYWFPFVLANERSGAELILGLVIAITHLNGYQIFMPVIFALGLMLICAICGLVFRDSEHRSAAIITGAFMAVSAETTLGIEYQLIAQVFGLGALCAAFALTIRVIGRPFRREWPAFVLASGSIAALGIIYPEVFPFFALALAAYTGVTLLRGSLSIRAAAWALLLVAIGAVVIMNGATRILLTVLLTRVAGVGGVTDVTLTPFPFFLYPSGVATLFGILPVTGDPGTVLTSIAIVAGFSLLALLLLAIAFGIWDLEPAAFIAATMFVLGISLFESRSGFGLYKLAMYFQPFIWGTFSTVILALFQRLNRSTRVSVA